MTELVAREIPVSYFVHETVREVVEATGAQWHALLDPQRLTEEGGANQGQSVEIFQGLCLGFVVQNVLTATHSLKL